MFDTTWFVEGGKFFQLGHPHLIFSIALSVIIFFGFGFHKILALNIKEVKKMIREDFPQEKKKK